MPLGESGIPLLPLPHPSRTLRAPCELSLWLFQLELLQVSGIGEILGRRGAAENTPNHAQADLKDLLGQVGPEALSQCHLVCLVPLSLSLVFHAPLCRFQCSAPCLSFSLTAFGKEASSGVLTVENLDSREG